jgi:hypothetical protein
MPRPDLDAIRKRRAGVVASTGPKILVAIPEKAQEFYLYAPTDVEALLAYVEELEAMIGPIGVTANAILRVLDKEDPS